MLAVAARTGTDELRPPLARLASERAVRRLTLAPLGAAGVKSVLEGALGSAANAELVDASLEATGGNPWFVSALAGELARAGPGAIGAAEVRALAPHAIAAAVDARVAAVAEGPALARALVTLGEHAELRQAATLAELTLERSLEVRDELIGAGILRPDELCFAHAIIRDAVASSVSPGRQALDHRRAARLLAGERAARGARGRAPARQRARRRGLGGRAAGRGGGGGSRARRPRGRRGACWSAHAPSPRAKRAVQSCSRGSERPSSRPARHRRPSST